MTQKLYYKYKDLYNEHVRIKDTMLLYTGNEYKIPDVLSCGFSDDDIFTLLSQVSNLAIIGIIYTNIPTVGGWSVWEILLLHGYLLFPVCIGMLCLPEVCLKRGLGRYESAGN